MEEHIRQVKEEAEKAAESAEKRHQEAIEAAEKRHQEERIRERYEARIYQRKMIRLSIMPCRMTEFTFSPYWQE